MCKNNFLKGTLILICSGFLTKVLGFLIKVVYSRIIGTYGISLLTLALPTYSLLLSIATFSCTLSVAKLVSENKDRSIQVLTSAGFLILIINFLLIIIIYFTKGFIANVLLKNSKIEIILMCFALTLPFVSISSVIKGYFHGKQNMLPHATSNVIEQIIRLIIITLVLPKLMKISTLYAVLGLILLTIVSEICSIIVFIFFLPKHIHYNTNLLPSKKYLKDILNISLPNVSGRIIGNIGYFFKPIILTNLLLLNNYSSSYILNEYGIYNAYALNLLTMPAFFVSAISTSLLPEVSKYASLNKIDIVKKRIKESLIYSLILGIFFSFIISLFKDKILFSLYNTTDGSEYIKVLAPFFVLFYLESILSSSLQGLGYSKVCFQITLTGVLIKTIVMSILTFMNLGIYSLVYAEIVNIIYVVFLSFKKIKKVLT